MLCRACGMESRANDVCEWCKKPMQPGASVPPGQPAGQALNAPPPQPLGGRPLGQPLNAPAQPMMPLNAPALNQVPTAVPPPAAGVPPLGNAGTQVRVSLTGEAYEVPAAPPPPPPGTTSVVSGTYAGLPTGAITPQLVSDGMLGAEIPIGERWERFSAMFLPILALSMLLLHFVPSLFLWVALIDLFLVGLLMGASTAIPSYDDAFSDCAIVLVVCLFFGPVLAMIVYVIIGLVRQEFNPAMNGLLGGHVIVRSALSFAFMSNPGAPAMFATFGLFSLMSFFTVLVTFGGWILSSLFRPFEAV